METKSPTTPVKSREVIGVDLFSQRREVFGQHDTVFLPSSPTTLIPATEVDPIITSNHGKTTSNFKRNTPRYSSMRETTRTDENYDLEFRPRKYSDNFTSELNQSDDVDYRRSMTERTRRLSKLRRDFLTSNLHEPTNESPFNRVGARSSMPVRSASVSHYKIGSPTIHKFPFAEPYSTPTPVRKVVLDFGQFSNGDEGKENKDPEAIPKHQSLPDDTPGKVDHQKIFEELLKRYSPQRKPIDFTLPPTRPRVVASIPKSTSSTKGSTTDESNKTSTEKLTVDDEVFKSERCLGAPKEESSNVTINEYVKDAVTKLLEAERSSEIEQNDPKPNENKVNSIDNNHVVDSKISLSELEEKNDRVPELKTIQRQISKESERKVVLETITDIRIPALIDKMSAEGEDLENSRKKGKKVKRKRSFLDKVLGRNKNKEKN